MIERALRWLLWVAGVAAFVVVLARSDVRGALPVIASAGPLLAIGVLPFLVQIALDALAWRTLLGALGHRVAWLRLIEIRLSTEAVLLSVPGGSLIGESLKPYLLHRMASVPIAHTVASVGIKRCLLALAEAAYLGIALLAAHDLYARCSAAVVGTESLAWYVAAAIAVLAIIPLGLEARRAGFAAADAAFVTLGQRRARIAIAWLPLLAAWLVETGETYLLCRLVGIELDVTHVLAMEAAVVFARNAAVFVPAGLGVQDAGYLAFLSAFGVAAPLAAAFVVVKRTKELIWIAIGYLLLLVLDRRGPREPASTVSVAAPLGAGLGGL